MHPYPAAITLHTSFGLGWTILAAVLLIALAAWSYRWTRPPLPVWARAGLAVFRALALIAVLLLAAEFEVRWVNDEEVKPRVGLLLDASESMSFTDASGVRADSISAVLDSEVWPELRRDIDLEPAAFSASLDSWKGRSLPDLDGAVTDMEAVLNEYAGRAEGPPDALVLISDGAFNHGGAYTAAARRLNVPIHAIAIGDSLPTKDLVISSLVAPRLGYAGEPFPLDITVRATGADGESARIRVIGEDGQILSTQDITIDGTWSEQTVTVDLTPQTAGINSWTVEVDLRDDARAEIGAPAGSASRDNPEVDLTNNSRRAVIRAAERRRTVLVFAPVPNSDAGAVARALEDDPDTDAIIVIGGGKMTRPVRGSWDDVDPSNLDAAFVFLQGPWTANSLDAVRILAESNLPVAWIAGDEHLPNNLLELIRTQLGGPQLWMETREALLRPVAAHALFTDAGLFFDEGVTPPMPRGPYRPNEGRVLAVVDTDEEEVPTVVVTSEQPRTLAWHAGGLAAWDRVRRANDPGGEGFNALLDRTLRWLTGGGEQERITVRPEQELYAGGEEVRLVASVTDPGLNAVEDARVTATVTRRAVGGTGSTRAGDDARGSSATADHPEADGDQSRTVEFQSLGGGRYLSTFLAWGEGRYSYEATVESDQEMVVRSGEFVVDRFELETAERRMRPDRLRALAEATGGSVIWSSSELDTLLHLLPRTGEIVDVRGSWRPFGLWLTLLLVVGVLAVEWIVRTRTGMV